MATPCHLKTKILHETFDINVLYKIQIDAEKIIQSAIQQTYKSDTTI